MSKRKAVGAYTLPKRLFLLFIYATIKKHKKQKASKSKMQTEIKGKGKINRKKIARKKCKLRYASLLAILFYFYFVVIFVWVFNLFCYQLTVYRWILSVCLFVFHEDERLDKILHSYRGKRFHQRQPGL